jgi:hypothetical protein
VNKKLVRLRALARLGAIALLAAACRGDRNSAARLTRAGDPWYLEPSEECGFDSTVVWNDPVALVKEFVQRDGDGEFLAPNTWFNSAVDCPGHEEEPESLVVVGKTTITPLASRADTARVEVSYTRLGSAQTDPGDQLFEPDSGSFADTITVSRSRFGWRIASPADAQRVSAASALARLTFRPADRDRLARAARTP